MLIPENNQVIQSIKAEKIINYPELHAISGMIYTAGVSGVDIVANWVSHICTNEKGFSSFSVQEIRVIIKRESKIFKFFIRIKFVLN